MTLTTTTCKPLRRSLRGKVFTKQTGAYDRTTLVLSMTAGDAKGLRSLAQSVILKGDRKAPMSLIARRALQVYQAMMRRPEAFTAEVVELERMVTPVPKPAPQRPS